MSLDRTLAVVERVLRQLRHDHRTLGLLFVVPSGLLWLLSEVLAGQPQVFDRVGPMLLGLFPFVLMFVVTSIAVLRERTTGTLDRLMVSPIGRGDILAGYGIAFSLLALAQALITMTVALWLLDMPNEGGILVALVLVLGNALVGVALGLFLSAFARTEFQAVQFLPAVVIPQVLLGGLLVPLEQMAGWLEAIARALPLTYCLDALSRVMVQGQGIENGSVATDLAVIYGSAMLLLAAGALTLRRVEA